MRVNWRSALAMVAAVLWVSAPVLACLPNEAMTAEEMACCQQMAGNCDMGGGEHKCCDTSVNHAAPSTALPQSAAAHGFAMIGVVNRAPIEELTVLVPEGFYETSVLPSASPPGCRFLLKN
jgi:hypothetical protein